MCVATVIEKTTNATSCFALIKSNYNIFLITLIALIKSYHLHAAAVKSPCQRNDFSKLFEISNRFEFTSDLMETCS